MKEGIKSYVVYTIKTSIYTEPVYRRFSDFFALRNRMVERWPGVYIPNIPPKKAVGNLDKKLIDIRMKLLNSFCTKIIKLRELSNSEEMKIFLSESNDVIKALSAIPTQSYEELLEKYRRAFPNYYEVILYILTMLINCRLMTLL